MKKSATKRSKGFHLTKWFLDYIGEDGSVLIAYAARLSWRGISVPYSNMLWHRPGVPVKHKTRFTKAHMPRVEGGAIHWRHPGFKASGIWEKGGDPVEARLFESDGRHLDWHCFQPLSRVTLSLGGMPYSGKGYAEVLSMNFPTWEIPMKELRWGHVVAPGCWAVWIQIEGGHSRQWAWWNGTLAADCEISDEKLHFRHNGKTIFLDRETRLGEGRKIQKVVSKLVRYLPGFKKMIPEPFLLSEEYKWCSKATISGVGETPLQGWAVHEFVNFNPKADGTKGRKSA